MGFKMTISFDAITPYPEVNAMLKVLIPAVQEVLGESLVGMYLDGSLASGDFDGASDIDFVVVVRDEISEETFRALYAMHERIMQVDSAWAIQLEGSYLSLRGVRRCDPAFMRYPNLERGREERLKWTLHDETWDTHRYVLRERGIVIFGPDPKDLIDPVSPEQLRRAMQPALAWYAEKVLRDPASIQGRGYQSYLVLTMCRILYTLATGDVASKPAAARWAQARLEARWHVLIQRALTGRFHSEEDATPDDVQGTQDLIRHAVGVMQAG